MSNIFKNNHVRICKIIDQVCISSIIFTLRKKPTVMNKDKKHYISEKEIFKNEKKESMHICVTGAPCCTVEN